MESRTKTPHEMLLINVVTLQSSTMTVHRARPAWLRVGSMEAAEDEGGALVIDADVTLVEVDVASGLAGHAHCRVDYILGGAIGEHVPVKCSSMNPLRKQIANFSLRKLWILRFWATVPAATLERWHIAGPPWALSLLSMRTLWRLGRGLR